MITKTLLVGLAALTMATLPLTSTALAQTAATTQQGASDLSSVRYKTASVDGIKIFYREAGDPKKPTILLLHGYPSSSIMYRELIPLLAHDFHVVAPDYPGSGFSDAPPADKFTPTFANLATVMGKFTRIVGLNTFAIYMQDFGGPVGFRIATDHPDWVNGLIIQNANAYLEGIAPVQLEGMKARTSGNLTPAQNAEVDQVVSSNLTMFLYQTGVRDFAAMDPTGYSVDNWILAQPENHRIQRALIVDYYSNVLEYPRWQAFMRERQPKTLIVWGKNDQIFLPPGAEAYKRDLPKAELHYFNTGHFALEEDAPGIASEIKKFFAAMK